MLKNIHKMAISKHILIPLILITLMFTSFAVSMDNAYAVDVNGSVNEIGYEVIGEDKLENSQQESDALENSASVNDEIISKNELDEQEILSAGNTYTVTGGSFKKIQNAIDNANSGDTLNLYGNFYSTGNQVNITKKLTITSTSGAVLDGKDLSRIFYVQKNGAGSYMSNIEFVNGNSNRGGAIYINAKDVTVDNCQFENNHASDSAGAICFIYRAEDGERGVIKNCYFKENSAVIAAGALGAYSNKSQVINCVFDSNYAYGDEEAYGGAIQIGTDDRGTWGTVVNCTFKNNWAKTTNPEKYTSHAGAGCIRNGSSYINCIFINNTADRGGAMLFHGIGTVDNCLFINNTATMFGGAITIDLLHDYMKLDIKNSDFEGNEAPLGGAIRLSGMNINIENCNFDNNHASVDGGAVNINAETVNVLNSKFNKNTADNDGGALYLIGKTTTVKNSEFIENHALPDSNKLNDGLGGAIYVNSTKATIQNNLFNYNTARNGSAVYYDKSGKELNLIGNTMFQNQAWVYALPIYAKDIYYGDSEEIKSIIHGGNNIAKYNNLATSNAIYNAAEYKNIKIDDETPISGATMTGQLYQDDREYNMDILLTVKHEDGQVVYNKTLKSSYLGEVQDTLNNLRPGKYYVTANHFEDTYYKAISNTTTFIVKPKVDNAILKTVTAKPSFEYGDYAVWTLNITNYGPNDATGVKVTDILPQGLIWISDDSNGKYNPKTGTLNVGFLAVGDNVIVNIVTSINKTDKIVNNANVTANEYDINLNNNHDDESITVNPASDLEVIKKVNNSNPNYNDLVKWTVTVKNNGPDTAHNVMVSDILPKALTWVSDDGNYNQNTGIWNIGTLDVGKQVTLNMVTRVKATGTIKNTVSVSGKEHDYNLANNNDSESINVKKSTDLAITKTVNTTKANYNDLVKWTLTVVNNGPDAATGVKVVDVLPKGFIFVKSVVGKGSYSNGVFNVGNLAVGEKVVLELISRVNATGSFKNTVDVSGNEYDYNMANNHDDESVTVNPASDLEVVKKVNNSNPNYNDLVKWTVTVKNNGLDTAHEVTVKDILPKTLIYISNDKNYNQNTGIWNIGTLDVGKQVTLNIVTRVNTTGNIKNTASVSGKEYDYNPVNNNDSESINVKKSTDLSIVKSVNASNVNFADLVKWTLTVANNGPDAATGVKVVDVLPKGFIFVKSVVGKGSYSNGVFNVGNLAVGEKVVLELISRVNATGSFKNTADVSGNEYDYNMANNHDDESITVNPASDLEVVKKVNNSNPNYNDLVKWTVTVKNNGPDTAHEIIVDDLLPSSLIWVSDNTNGKYNVRSGKLTIDQLNNKQTITFEFVTRVNSTGITQNNVSVSAKEYDYNLNNNHDDETINVSKSADVTIIKIVNETNPNYHDIVKWTLIASNNGPDKANNVSVEEILPEGLILIDAIATKGYYENGVWFVCCLEKGETETLEIICEVNKTGKITNHASITANEYDHNLTNNNDDESINVPLAVDLEVIKQVTDNNPYFGESVTWMISVTNHGPDNANDVILYDILDDSLIYENYISSKGEYRDGKWVIGDLANGATEYINISCIPYRLGVIINEAQVNSSQYDWNKVNNYDDEYIEVAPVADLSLIKLVNETNPNYGDLIKWTLIVTNNGPNNATDVSVYDTIPEGLTLIKTNIVQSDEGIFNIGELATGETIKIEMICKVTSTGYFNNFASVYGAEYDPDLENNYDEKAIEVPPASDLAITKTVSKYYYTVGDIINYVIKLVNNGPDTAENIVVDEILDDGLKIKSFKTSKGSFDALTKSWEISELAAGDVAELKLKVVAEKEGVLDNTVSVSSDTYDFDLTNNEDSVSVNVTEKPQKPTDTNQNVNKNNNYGGNTGNVKSDDLTNFISNNNVTGNPFVVLLLSFLVSIVFLGRNIFK